MDDLISRAALLKECEECQKTDPRFEKRGWANHFINESGEPSTEWYCVEDMIENAPTIDAIPVEWLEKHADNCREEMEFDVCEAIRTVIKEWQKEQEANDG